MEYDFKLFVHGVPDGQDIWGGSGADSKYLELFYGRRSSVASQLILEVMQLEGKTNAYYTYYYNNGKVQANNGRSGSYFALTLRINYYYSDIRNIYNLLEAAFNKYIVGSALEWTNGDGIRYKISNFGQINDVLVELEKEIEHYLLQFSSNADFVPINGFKSNGQNECGTINLLEAMPDVVAKHVKSTGKISVSPYHSSSSEQQIINKMTAEINAVKDNAQQQISAVQQKAKQDVLAAQKDKDQGIQAVKNEYKDADKTISQLRAQNDEASRKISELSDKVSKLSDYKAKYEGSKDELESSRKLIAQIKKSISGSPDTIVIGAPPVRKRKENKWVLAIKFFHPFVDYLVMAVLLVIIGVTLPKSCASKDGASDNVEQQSQPDVAHFELAVGGHEASPAKETEIDIQSLKNQYPKARIDVSHINESQKQFMKVSSGLNYVITVQGAEGVDGEWEYDHTAFHMHDNNIIPKKSGTFTITYKVNGKDFLTRNITVEE